MKIRDSLIKFLKARGLLRRGNSDTMAVLEALDRWLASSDAEFVLVNLEEEPQNTPGMPERSCRRKMRMSREVTRLLKAVNEERHGK